MESHCLALAFLEKMAHLSYLNLIAMRIINTAIVSGVLTLRLTPYLVVLFFLDLRL